MRLRGLVLGGVIVAGLIFFVLVVIFPALGLPGVGDWFGKSGPPTAPADQSHGLAAVLVDGQSDTLRLAPDVVKGLGVKTEVVSHPKDMRTLTLSGSLNLDPDYLAHVHPRFQGEVIEIGPYIPPARPRPPRSRSRNGRCASATGCRRGRCSPSCGARTWARKRTT